MRKVILLKQFQHLITEVPTAEEMIPVIKEDIQKFGKLINLVLRDYVDDEILSTPPADLDWLGEQLYLFFSPAGTFWEHIQNGELQTYSLITKALLEIPLQKGGLVYV